MNTRAVAHLPTYTVDTLRAAVALERIAAREARVEAKLRDMTSERITAGLLRLRLLVDQIEPVVVDSPPERVATVLQFRLR